MPNQPHQRRGLTTIETLVSFLLLATVIGVTGPLVVRHNRLLSDQRDYRRAIDTVHNELDRLTALHGEELAAALDQLSKNEVELDGQLTGRVDPAEWGERITLRFEWPAAQRGRPDIELIGWSFASESESGGSS